MNWKTLLKRTIKSFAKKYDIKINENLGTLTLNNLVVFESETNNIYNEKTLSFLEGFHCAVEISNMKK